VTWRHWHDGTAFDDDTSRAFGVVVAIEVGAAGLGAAVLSIWRQHEFVPVWVAFVVGVHLFPVAALIRYAAIHVAAALITVAAVLAVPVARSRSIAPSAVVGAATGAVLLAAAFFSTAAAALH
jgi:hypothetical protein